MAVRFVERGGDQVVYGVFELTAIPGDEEVTLEWTDVTKDVVFGSDAPVVVPGSPGFFIYHNGGPATFAFNNNQLGSISLGIAAYDGQIGMGTMTVPGNPGWVAGDRITFTDESGRILYTGYVGDWSISRNGASPTEFETTYTLMDLNRQLIGRQLVNWAAGVSEGVVAIGRAYITSNDWIRQFIDMICPDVTFDETYLDVFSPVDMPVKAYTGDGFMDLGADLIQYTGKTFFLVPSQTENVPEFHFHDLVPGPILAGINVSDDSSQVDYLNVWPMTDPVKSMTAADLKNDVTGMNGTVLVPGDNPTSVTAHGAGGLKWQGVLQYAVSEADLLTKVNSILSPLDGAGDERPTYSFGIEWMRGSDIIRVPAGSMVGIESQIIDVVWARVGHLTLTVQRDLDGTPLPGIWSMAVELGYPFRQPASVRGYGGQGGDAGRLSAEFPIADHIDVVQPDILPPVGESMIITGYLRSESGAIVNNLDVPIYWTLEQWQDEAGTVPSTAWSLDDDVTLTDRFGKAVVILSHDNSGTWSWIKVHAEL